MADKSINNNRAITFESGGMNVNINNSEKSDLYKTFPYANQTSAQTPSTPSLEPSEIFSSGTGFSLSKEGYIVTNFHIDGANEIFVKGVNSDYNVSHKANVVLKDINNGHSCNKNRR